MIFLATWRRRDGFGARYIGSPVVGALVAEDGAGDVGCNRSGHTGFAGTCGDEEEVGNNGGEGRFRGDACAVEVGACVFEDEPVEVDRRTGVRYEVAVSVPPPPLPRPRLGRDLGRCACLPLSRNTSFLHCLTVSKLYQPIGQHCHAPMAHHSLSVSSEGHAN
eukprot:scaffold4097_cov166-Amphora_coffeaeformis.AAC.42